MAGGGKQDRGKVPRKEAVGNRNTKLVCIFGNEHFDTKFWHRWEYKVMHIGLHAFTTKFCSIISSFCSPWYGLNVSHPSPFLRWSPQISKERTEHIIFQCEQLKWRLDSSLLTILDTHTGSLWWCSARSPGCKENRHGLCLLWVLVLF